MYYPIGIKEIEKNGGKIIEREVTIEVNGIRVRVDICSYENKTLYLIEVKNGPYAGFTPNQNYAYPLMKDGNIPIIPYGSHAENVSGFIMENNAAIYWKVGQPTTQYTLRIIRY